MSSNKILLLTVKSYNENIGFQDYVSDLGKRWHIDKNKHGRTILIVFTKEKRMIALTLGAAVKGLSESQANEIMSKNVIPEFKQHQYYLGIRNCIIGLSDEWK